MTDKTEKYYAIIVAAGTGKRMNSSVKKQYMEIAGYPVLYHTLKAFEESEVGGIIIVTGADETEYVTREIVEKYGFKKVKAVCIGGKERCDSVYEGLKILLKNDTPTDIVCKDDGQAAGMTGESGDESYMEPNGYEYVLIHDGVRPLITSKMIDYCIEQVKEFGAVIPGVPEKDTVKEANTDMEVTGTPDRKKLYRIQTPQCFKLELIKEAFEKYYNTVQHDSNDIASGQEDRKKENLTAESSVSITDDAMLVEKYTGHKVKIIEGDYKNIKITTPEDIELAEFYLKSIKE